MQEKIDYTFLKHYSCRIYFTLQNFKGEKIKAKQRVAVAYNKTFYVRGVTKVFEKQNKVEVNFLKKAKPDDYYYTWPKCKGIAIVSAEFIFCTNVNLLKKE